MAVNRQHRELVPLLCCGLTWDRSNMRRKSFFSSTSGRLFICSAVYGVVRGARGAGGEGVFLLPCAGGGERLRSLISLLLFHLFCARMSSRWASVVRPNTRRKSTFFEGRESLTCEDHKYVITPVPRVHINVCGLGVQFLASRKQHFSIF